MIHTDRGNMYIQLGDRDVSFEMSDTDTIGFEYTESHCGCCSEEETTPTITTKEFFEYLHDRKKFLKKEWEKILKKKNEEIDKWRKLAQTRLFKLQKLEDTIDIINLVKKKNARKKNSVEKNIKQ